MKETKNLFFQSFSTIPISLPVKTSPTYTQHQQLTNASILDSNSFLLFDMQGEFYQSSLNPRTERFSLRPFVPTATDQIGQSNDKDKPNLSELPQNDETPKLFPWGAIAWERPVHTPNSTNLPILHIGSHLINGSVINTHKDPIILVRCITSQSTNSNQNAESNFSQLQNSTTSTNSDSNITESHTRWEVNGVIYSYLEFSKPPILNPSKLANLKLWLNSNQMKKELLLNKWQEQNTQISEVWKLVLSDQFTHIYDSWRLIKADNELLSSIRQGQKVEFKTCMWMGDSRFNNSLVVCTYTATYNAERNEHDGNILLGIKFHNSQVFGNEITETGNEENMSYNGSTKPSTIPITLGIPILGKAKSFLVLNKGNGHTNQIEIFLKKFNRGVTTPELIHSIQASEIEILTTLTNIRFDEVNTSIYYQGYWTHLDLLQWYDGLKHLLISGSYSQLDFSNKNLTISQFSQCVDICPLTSNFPYPFQPSIISQILRFCCFFNSSFWDKAYTHLPQAQSLISIPSNIMKSYTDFLDNDASECKVIFYIPKLVRFIIMCEILKHGQDYIWSPPTHCPSLQLPIKQISLTHYIDRMNQTMSEVIPTSLLMMEYSSYHIEIFNKLRGISNVFGIELNSHTLPITDYNQWNLHTQGFPYIRCVYTDQFLQNSHTHYKFLDGKIDLLRNDIERIIKTSQSGLDWVSQLSLLRGLVIWNTHTHTLLLLNEKHLPRQLRERLMALFSLKSIWYDEELEFYIRPIIGYDKDLTATLSGPPSQFCFIKTEQIEGKFLLGNENFTEKLTKFFSWNLPISHWEI